MNGAGIRAGPEAQGRVVTPVAWEARARDWLPTAEDRAFVQSLMGQVVEPGKFSNWISPPTNGINSQAVECEYVRFNQRG
jgi:benzoyl-CoA 2,3-epoxidase subunit B